MKISYKPSYYLVSFLLAMTLIFSTSLSQAQDCDGAIDCLEKGKKAFVNSDAINLLNKAIKLAKKEKLDLSEYYYYRGVRYYGMKGEEKKAEKDFDAAIKIDPSWYSPYSWKVDLYQVKFNDYEKSKKWMSEVERIFPDDARVYYDLGHLHRYFRHMNLAFPQFEKAYAAVLSNSTSVAKMSESDKVDAVRWFAVAYLKMNNLFVHDQNSLEILQNGEKVLPTSPEILGDLALAYYDNDNLSKAEEYAQKAAVYDAANVYERKNSGGEFMRALKMREEKKAKSASTAMVIARKNMIHSHPAIYYWYAIAVWEECYAIADTNPGWFKTNKMQIIENFKLAIEHGEGTKYQYLVKSARESLATLNK